MEDDLDGLDEENVIMRTIEGLSVAKKAEQFDFFLNETANVFINLIS